MTLIRTTLRALVFLPVCIISAEAQVPSLLDVFCSLLKIFVYLTKFFPVIGTSKLLYIVQY